MPTENNNNRKSNILCFISLGCLLMSFIVEALASHVDISIEIIENTIEALPFLFALTAFVLMITARVICKKNVFAKVLMWVYIALIILVLIWVIIMIFFFALICSACFGNGELSTFCDQCVSCGQIGIFYVTSVLKTLI